MSARGLASLATVLAWTALFGLVAASRSSDARWHRLVRARLSDRSPAGALPSPWSAFGLGPVFGRSRRRRAEADIVRALPDLVALFELAIGGGLNVTLALELVAPRAPPAVRPATVEVAGLVAGGARTADALARLPEHLGEPVRPLVSALLASERYGAPLLPALERVAADARLRRRVAAEEAARRVPVKLLFPLVLCILPAFAALTVLPLLAGALRALRL